MSICAHDLISMVAADPNVSPAFAAAIRPVGFGRYDNYVISNRLGQRVTGVFARSPEQALQLASAPDGYTARVERYGCPVDGALRESAAARYGRLD